MFTVTCPFVQERFCGFPSSQIMQAERTTEAKNLDQPRKCVIPVVCVCVCVCVKLGKWYVVKHNCVT